MPGQAALAFADARELFARAAAHPTVEGCFAIQTFRHLARRDERGAADACLIRDLEAAGRAVGFSLTQTFEDALVRVALAPRAN